MLTAGIPLDKVVRVLSVALSTAVTTSRIRAQCKDPDFTESIQDHLHMKHVNARTNDDTLLESTPPILLSKQHTLYPLTCGSGFRYQITFGRYPAKGWLAQSQAERYFRFSAEFEPRRR